MPIEEEDYVNRDEQEVSAFAGTSKKVTSGGSEHDKNRKPAQRSKKNGQCYMCAEKGHYAREYSNR